MIIKKVRNITLKVFIVFILLWGGLWSYYQIALSWNYFGKIGYYGPDTSQGMIAKSLQDDMEKYRNTHGTYPKIGEYCQDILVLKPYFGESTHGNFKYQYGYQWFLPYLYPETNILLHPLALWKFSVSVKDDGSAYVFRVEDRNDPLAGIMHIVARYIVRADLSNERILSLSPEGSFFPKRTSLISGTVFGCDCTGLNYCVGGNYRAQYQSPHNN